MDIKNKVTLVVKAIGRRVRLVRPDNRWGTNPEQFFEGMKSEEFLFFSPHQDDEVLSMGVPLAELSVRGHRAGTRVVVCSDGEKSRVVRILGDGQSCDFHEGEHVFDLTEKEFSEARDREFIASCEALGVLEENIVVPKRRAPDGQMTVEKAREIILEYVDDAPEAVVCVIGPSDHGYDRSVQHRDHRALGQAAVDLYKEGKIRKLFCFMEPSGARNFRINNLGVRLTKMKASPAAGRLVSAALAEYRRWRPEAGRYAVGKHSVSDLIEATDQQQTAYFWVPSRNG